MNSRPNKPSLLIHDHRSNNAYVMERKKFRTLNGGFEATVSDVGDSSNILVTMSVNMLRSQVRMYDVVNKQMIGSVYRESRGIKKFMSGLDSFHISIRNGADISLMVMVTICFQELFVKGAK